MYRSKSRVERRSKGWRTSGSSTWPTKKSTPVHNLPELLILFVSSGSKCFQDSSSDMFV